MYRNSPLFFLLLGFTLVSLTQLQAQRKKKGKSKYSPVENISREEAWPIVAQAVQYLKLDVTAFDYGKGELLTSYYNYKKGIVPNRGKIYFQLKDNTLHIDVVDLQLKSAETGEWKPTYPDPLFPKEKRIKAEIADAVRAIMADESKRELAMTGFASNAAFHGFFFKTASGLAGDIWLDQFLKNRQITWVLEFADIQKSEHEGFKYIEIHNHLNRASRLKIQRLTSSDGFVFTNKGSKNRVQGVVTSLKEDNGTWILTLEDR